VKASPVVLARLLAERMSVVVPPPVIVRAHGSMVWASTPQFPGGGTDLELWSDDDNDARVRQGVWSAAYNVLNHVQDYVSEELKWPWPRDPNRARTFMPMPMVSIENGRLRLGYGEADRPTLELESIDLADIADGIGGDLARSDD